MRLSAVMIETTDPAERRVSHYRVLHSIGSGGMGDVFLGLDETLKRKVALKSIRAEHRISDLAKARFLREARILSQLDHPCICRALDYIEEPDGDWLVLEYIEGRSLRDALKAGLPAATQLRIAEQIAGVLVVTHAAGIVHRDLKPGNVMLLDSGDIKVLDFGLARADFASAPAAEAAVAGMITPSDDEETRSAGGSRSVSWDPESSALFSTQLGSLSGTPAYMSPEQARGEAVTTASDMFSFGLVLQELFTGRRAYPTEAAGGSLIERVQAGTTIGAQGVSADLGSLLRRLTAAVPSQRPTAVEALDRLRWIIATPKRRLRRLAIAAAILLAIAGLAKYTIDLRRERTAAVLARQDAERRRDQAEDLIGFMLGDLRAKLQQAGRLELLQGVSGKAMAYFAAVPAASLSSEEIFRRSQSISQIGQLRQAQGDLKAALESYREALRIAAELAAREPANADWQFGLGTAHFFVADALRKQGDLKGAMTEFAAYRDVAIGLTARDPSNVKWLLELSYGHGGVAAVQEALGDLTGARRELEFALKVKEDVAAREPASLESQQAVANGHNRLGVVLEKLGEADAAMQHFRADLGIRQQLVAADEKNNAIKRQYLVALSFVSFALLDRGDVKAAAGYAVQARDVAATLASLDPANADWQRDLAVTEGRVGTTLRLDGAQSEAKTRFERALAIMQPLAASTTNTSRVRELATVHVETGWTRFALGDLQGAQHAASSAETTVTPLVAKNTDGDALRIAAESRLLAAAVADRRGQSARALQLRDSALPLVKNASTYDRRSIAARARILLALGRRSDAEPLVQQLFASKYRHPLLVAEWERKSPVPRR